VSAVIKCSTTSDNWRKNQRSRTVCECVLNWRGKNIYFVVSRLLRNCHGVYNNSHETSQVFPFSITYHFYAVFTHSASKDLIMGRRLFAFPQDLCSKSLNNTPINVSSSKSKKISNGKILQ
jgi:hypothetical protein